MIPRERWLAVLRREKPDRLPMDYHATDEATQQIIEYKGYRDYWGMIEDLHIDPMLYVEPTYVGPSLSPGYDIYGCQFIDVDYGGGVYSECISHPLAAFNSIGEIIDNYTWPCVDWFDYGTLSQKIEGLESYPLRGGGSEPF